MKFGKNLVNSLRSFLKEEFTDTRTDEQTDGLTDRQTHVGHSIMTIARWPLASGANNRTMMALYRSPEY